MFIMPDHKWRLDKRSPIECCDFSLVLLYLSERISPRRPVLSSRTWIKQPWSLWRPLASWRSTAAGCQSLITPDWEVLLRFQVSVQWQSHCMDVVSELVFYCQKNILESDYSWHSLLRKVLLSCPCVVLLYNYQRFSLNLMRFIFSNIRSVSWEEKAITRIPCEDCWVWPKGEFPVVWFTYHYKIIFFFLFFTSKSKFFKPYFQLTETCP